MIHSYIEFCSSYEFATENNYFKVGVLSEQSERQSRRIQDLEKMIAAKKDMLRHTEQVNFFKGFYKWPWRVKARN